MGASAVRGPADGVEAQEVAPVPSRRTIPEILVSIPAETVALLAVVAVSLAGVLAVVVLVLALRLRALGARYRVAIGPDAPDDLVAAVAGQAQQLASLRDDLGTVHGNTTTLRELQKASVSRVGLVRYDAFPDMGGRLSFSAALLDERGDGVVISAINGRQETRAYGKPVVGADSEHTLSDEEKAAVAAALDAGRSDALADPGGRRRRRA